MRSKASQSELLSHRIRDTLIDEISSGSIAAGTSLDEQQLATRFGVSRTPVRDALHQLAANGLIENGPRRGMIVSRLSPDHVMDLFEAMAELEAVCVRLATYRMTAAERSTLFRIHERTRAASVENDVDAYDELNQRFHEMFYEGTHNDALRQQAQSLRGRLRAFRRAQLRSPNRLLQSRDEHDGILQAIARGDGEEASKRMRAHMTNAGNALEQQLSSLEDNP